MKKASILILLILLFPGCTGTVKDTLDQNQIYSNSTESTKPSVEKIDGTSTYEISFNLEKPADCMSIELEAVYLNKSFPIQRVPKNSFFIVEKRLKLAQFNLKTDKFFTQIGRNFNNDWEIYSPVKICTNNADPLSMIDASEYRIRFSTFEKRPFYYVVKIACESKVIFNEYNPSAKK
jgi:hypothetical protein